MSGRLDAPFTALADPTRRAIIARMSRRRPDRDAHLSSGMESGADLALDHLEDVAQSIEAAA